MNWRDHISSDPQICHGTACIKGTRVMVSVILDSLGAGEAPAEIASAYQVSEEDIQATLHYAAELTRERVVPLPGAA
ncbi:MAG TPA: DUF433 domain-containing protein [Phycisphaerae bacterium]|nr:DUF433 domain-containing protein [Phycisphaerae bacterium]